MRLSRIARALLLAAAVTSVALASGCGGEDPTASAKPAACTSAKEARSEYLTTLCEFSAAAAADKVYDAYGFAEYFPKPQRAAIHAFCFVADRMLEDDEVARLADRVYLIARVTRKAETDLKSELDIVAPRPTGKAIARLEAILDLDSLGRDLAEGYVGACY
ncbi:MAG: hypothetical protein WA687_12250 [Solirubrobacterales bacterium]